MKTTDASPTTRREQARARRAFVVWWLQLLDDAGRLLNELARLPEGALSESEHERAFHALDRVWDPLANDRPMLPASTPRPRRLKGGA